MLNEKTRSLFAPSIIVTCAANSFHVFPTKRNFLAFFFSVGTYTPDSIIPNTIL